MVVDGLGISSITFAAFEASAFSVVGSQSLFFEQSTRSLRGSSDSISTVLVSEHGFTGSVLAVRAFAWDSASCVRVPYMAEP